MGRFSKKYPAAPTACGPTSADLISAISGVVDAARLVAACAARCALVGLTATTVYDRLGAPPPKNACNVSSVGRKAALPQVYEGMKITDLRIEGLTAA